MKISLIVAMAQNHVIGRDNQLPWRLPADLQHFKALTMGKPVIMGRKTWESLGRPLPGRTNIVITRDVGYQAEGCVVVHSVEQALEVAAGSDEAMVIGGANLYRQLLDRADRLYLTLVKADVEGDTWFPEFNLTQWHEVEREAHTRDDKNEFDFEFVTLERIT
ncbi:dihydrofolate reductase [Thiogranum longum]|uniref:Dihydrofolate reductase n=1 Tax=Thiogranum longum TaxID=1537524 RepID=A0A4R1HIP9_9GAMM|nr:type 3 dihydrofolate reductase [Thiogranum longum]TCK19329.1 dihydrofolate reductase [Thiogranum longum]